MKNVIQFSVTKGLDGNYVASGIGHHIFTQAETLDELQANIREAVELYVEGEDLAELGFAEQPSLLMNVALPRFEYAQV